MMPKTEFAVDIPEPDALAFLGHLVAVQAGDHRRGRSGDIQEYGRKGSAIAGGDVNPHQENQGYLGIQAESEGNENRHGYAVVQARQRPHYEPYQHTEEKREKNYLEELSKPGYISNIVYPCIMRDELSGSEPQSIPNMK